MFCRLGFDWLISLIQTALCWGCHAWDSNISSIICFLFFGSTKSEISGSLNSLSAHFHVNYLSCVGGDIESKIWPSSESQSSWELGRELAFLALYSNRTEEETEPPDSRTCRQTRPASWAERQESLSGHTRHFNQHSQAGRGKSVCTRTVAAQHPWLDQRGGDGALIEHAWIPTRRLAPRPCYQHLYSALQRTRRWLMSHHLNTFRYMYLNTKYLLCI